MELSKDRLKQAQGQVRNKINVKNQTAFTLSFFLCSHSCGRDDITASGKLKIQILNL